MMLTVARPCLAEVQRWMPQFTSDANPQHIVR